MTIALGYDHVGFIYKDGISDYLKELGYEVKHLGAVSTERTDYPLYAEKVCRAVVSGECQKGILICGTGVGMSIAANKIKGIRAVACSDPYSAILSRQHNNTNILTFGSRVVGIELAKLIVKLWLESEYEGGRHQKRIDMITKLEIGETL
jgi:ribose 5-phosphate isomerase B